MCGVQKMEDRAIITNNPQFSKSAGRFWNCIQSRVLNGLIARACDDEGSRFSCRYLGATS